MESENNNEILELLSMKVDDKLGVSKEYNRIKFDDVPKRKVFKKEYFEDKKTKTDYITGELLHSDSKAAKAKYKKSLYTKHSSDVDHIIPAKTAHYRLKRNPFLSNNDVKKIINDKSNYRVTSSNLNRRKSDRSNVNIAFDREIDLSLESRIKLLGDHTKAKTLMELNTAMYTAKNITNEFTYGAKVYIEDSTIPIVIESINNLVLVASGEKDFKEATNDIGKLTTNVAITGGTIRVFNVGLSNMTNNLGNDILKSCSNQLNKVIAVSLILKDSVISYISGEINGKEFFKQIGEKGVNLLASSIGAIVGQTLIPVPIVGAIIGSALISSVCSEICNVCNKIYSNYKAIDEYKEKIRKINSFANQAVYEIEKQRGMLSTIINDYFDKWDKEVTKGISEIYDSIINNNIDGLSNGLNRILDNFGKEVKFSSFEEFDDFFSAENCELNL